MVATIRRFDQAVTCFPVTRQIGDERLQREVQDILRTSGYAVLASLRCQVDHGTLTLTGSVPSFYLKQLAQHHGARTSGVEKVQNHVSVVDT